MKHMKISLCLICMVLFFVLPALAETIEESAVNEYAYQVTMSAEFEQFSGYDSGRTEKLNQLLQGILFRLLYQNGNDSELYGLAIDAGEGEALSLQYKSECGTDSFQISSEPGKEYTADSKADIDVVTSVIGGKRTAETAVFHGVPILGDERLKETETFHEGLEVFMEEMTPYATEKKVKRSVQNIGTTARQISVTFAKGDTEPFEQAFQHVYGKSMFARLYSAGFFYGKQSLTVYYDAKGTLIWCIYDGIIKIQETAYTVRIDERIKDDPDDYRREIRVTYQPAGGKKGTLDLTVSSKQRRKDRKITLAYKSRDIISEQTMTAKAELTLLPKEGQQFLSGSISLSQYTLTGDVVKTILLQPEMYISNETGIVPCGGTINVTLQNEKTTNYILAINIEIDSVPYTTVWTSSDSIIAIDQMREELLTEQAEIIREHAVQSILTTIMQMDDSYLEFLREGIDQPTWAGLKRLAEEAEGK